MFSYEYNYHHYIQQNEYEFNVRISPTNVTNITLTSNICQSYRYKHMTLHTSFSAKPSQAKPNIPTSQPASQQSANQPFNQPSNRPKAKYKITHIHLCTFKCVHTNIHTYICINACRCVCIFVKNTCSINVCVYVGLHFPIQNSLAIASGHIVT